MLHSHSAKLQNGAMFSWNDLKYFVAVATKGSTLAAAKALGTSQTTVARRITALEESLGLVLFERRQDGYVMTPAGEALLQQGQAVESAVEGFGDAAASQSRELTGEVCLSAADIYASTVLAPVFRAFHTAYPDLRIEIDTTQELRDLSAGEADVALRSAKRIEGSGLVARRLADDFWTLYASREYASEHGIPHSRRELLDYVFIGGGGSRLWPGYREWLQEYDLESAVAMHHSSETGLLAAVRAGLGIAVLPSFVADREPGLVRCLPPRPSDTTGLWIVTHERLRHTPRVRAVMDFFADQITGMVRADRVVREAGSE